jgi:hypothetical protein
MALPFSTARRSSRRRAGAGGGVLELDRPRCWAGETVSGRVRWCADVASVALVRVEQHNRRSRAFAVARAAVTAPERRFELAVPDSALPSAAGRDCGLRYVVLAGRSADIPCAELEVMASGEPHLTARRSHVDRLLSGWAARHFHIELAEAQLAGGGAVRGRVHRHGSWPAGTIAVDARCLEFWRLSAPTDPRLPQWSHQVLWERRQPVPIDPDASWAPFRFDLPAGLPPAVEATTIAWRYELLAERDVRHWFNETAAVTPLLHEGPAG